MVVCIFQYASFLLLIFLLEAVAGVLAYMYNGVVSIVHTTITHLYSNCTQGELIIMMFCQFTQTFLARSAL